MSSRAPFTTDAERRATATSLVGSWLVAFFLLGLLIARVSSGSASFPLDAVLATVSLLVTLALSILTFYLLRPPAVAPSADPALAPASALPPTASALTPIPASLPSDLPSTKVAPPSPLVSIPAPEAVAQPVAPPVASVRPPQTQPDTPRIFISHSSGDNDFGYTLAADLEAALGPGSVWYDSAGGLKGGDVWWDRIVTELTDRPIFVVLLSPQALASAWVHDEIRLAWQQKNGERGKVIVPVLHQPCDPPVYVGMVQFVRFDNQAYETALSVLLDAVRAGETRMIRPQAVPTLRVGPPFQESDLPMPERFVGRVADLQWVEERLRQGGATSITAVRGMGGIGKTALAAVAVRELRWEGRFADGVAVIVCAEEHDAGHLLRTILLRFDEQSQIPDDATLTALGDLARQRLAAYKDALVVLDNVEPELDIAAVTRPLREAGLTLLLTARHMLPREAVPEQGSKTLELLSPDEALDLFAQSYGRGAALDLTRPELEAAREIVTILDRHTLAVKLAGAYATDQRRDLEKLAEELKNDPLKTPDDKETPRAVALVLGRSVETLPDDTQRLFAALAAFGTGEFGREAALALGRGIGLDNPEASADLLVRRALLDALLHEDMPAESDRERRRLHPLLRAEAGQRLALWSEEDQQAAHTAVAAWYARYANTTPDLALAPDEANIIGALEWTHEHAPDDLDAYRVISDICEAMREFWRSTGRTRAGLTYLPWGIDASNRVAAETEDTSDQRRAANIAVYYGDILVRTGRLSEAEKAYQQDLALRQQIDDKQGIGVALGRLGQIALARGQTEEANDYIKQGLGVFHEVHDRLSEGAALSELGLVAIQRGQLKEASEYLQQSLRIRREVEDQYGEGVVLSRLGEISLALGHLDEAEAAFKQGLAILRKVQDRQGEGVLLSFLGKVAMERKNWPEAEHYTSESMQIDRETQNRQSEGVNLGQLGQIAESQGKDDEAEERYREALAVLADAQDWPSYAAYAFNLGRFLLQRDRNRDEGCQMLAEAARLYDQMGIPGAERAREIARQLGCG